jgi:hypothetical protein
LYAACGLVLFTILFLAWLALQPQAAPLPTGPVLPGFSAARAQAHVQAHVQVLAQAPRPAVLAMARYDSGVAAPRGQVDFPLPLAGTVHDDDLSTWPLALLACGLGALACRRAPPACRR